MSSEIYKCFIASPGDTVEERAVCDKVFREISDTVGQILNFRIESKKWEANARPSFGEDGQAVITAQLLDDYQIFIGIMWNRFGTPTARADSGTEEEFDLAYKRYSEKGDVEIMMYFNDAAVKSADLDFQQAQKVRDFKGRVSSLGCFYCVYDGVGEFEEKLKYHLISYFGKKYVKDTVLLEDKSCESVNSEVDPSVLTVLEERLDDALNLFSNYKNVWVEPVISRTNDISQNADDNYKSKIPVEDIINSKKSIIIKSPPQFGLTCLAHYMIKEAWKSGLLWIYLDYKKMHTDSIKKFVNKELVKIGLSGRTIECLVLDSWCNTENGSKKFLRSLCDEYPNTQIIVMQSIDDIAFKNEEKNESIRREFDGLHLLALPRNQIRKVVSTYNHEKRLGDEDAVLNKVLKDLDALNIHRTALNCLTLLKASEGNFDESPINRTKMIEMVLFVLFNMEGLPTYKVKPDVKDCEYALGRFCEGLIRGGKYKFTREYFINELDGFCREKLLQLEISVVFDVLYANTIIVKVDSDFVFRSSFWVHYFAARRMYFDKNFREYILLEKAYISFPEVVEFYTGIDRDRADVLEILTKDLSEACALVEEKTGIPDDFNPLRFALWKPSPESIEKMQNEISEGVLNSNLPDSIKDQFADRNYNQLKPYDQSIQHILQEYSLTALIQNIKASSRALRNSDYVDSVLKKSLIKEITRGWKQISKIIFALTPLLAIKGRANFGGHGFVLDPDSNFGDSVEQKITAIFKANSINVVNIFKYDLFSPKMGPLIFDCVNNETDVLIKHKLILLLISERPLGWKKYVEDYITVLQKDSFYLLDTVNYLKTVYRYDFASESQLSDIRWLLKIGFAKHQFGGGKPDMGKIKKISNSVIPKRENTEIINE